jgi:hypothetical protein
MEKSHQENQEQTDNENSEIDPLRASSNRTTQPRYDGTNRAFRGSHHTFIQVRAIYPSDSDSSCFDSSDTDEDENKLLKTLQTDRYKYIGEVMTGKREGFGICYYLNGDKYVGYWENDRMHGLGRLTRKNGKQFSGEYIDNSIYGFVEYVNRQGVIHHGLMQGCKFIPSEPIEIHNSDKVFQGLLKYKEGKLSGVGTFTYSNNELYEGEVLDYVECGLGIYYLNDGSVYKGNNKDRLFNGMCEIQYPDGTINYGDYKDNSRNGLCFTIPPDGSYLIGIYSDDTRHGGFITISRECTMFELWYFGFCGLTIEKKENIIAYVNMVYPEYKHLLKLKNNSIWSILTK